MRPEEIDTQKFELEEINWNCRSDYRLFVNNFPESAKLASKRHCPCCIRSKNDEADDHYYRVEEGVDAVSGFNNAGVVEKLSDKIMEVHPLELQHHAPTATDPNSKHTKIKHRNRIPDRPNISLSIWSILKGAVGKDLTKIPIPVNFSEPLSMLQRLTEDFEYSDILDAAARCDNYTEELCLVAAFTVSSYASTAVRTTKPFNPLLGETYECDRSEDKGWKCINEQVKHHPPTVAQHCEGDGWTVWQDFTMKSKFKGNYLEIVPMGIAHLSFKNSGSTYSWRKVTTYVHNLVVGRLWVDNEGDMEIVNHKTGDRCTLKYFPQTTFGKEQKKVTGLVWNKQDVIRWTMNGYWDKHMEYMEVKAQKLIDGKSDPSLKNVTEYGPAKRGWTKRSPASDSDKYYNFTEFTCSLNEFEDGVAPTDSRLRPDQRLMEIGRWDEANAEKVRLEEKQRQSRKTRVKKQTNAADEDDDASEPLWFRKEKDPFNDTYIHVSNGEYWKYKNSGNWSMCPNIF